MNPCSRSVTFLLSAQTHKRSNPGIANSTHQPPSPPIRGLIFTMVVGVNCIHIMNFSRYGQY